MNEKKIKVGFDLDGVLLYNPARIFRPVTIALKKFLPKKKKPDIIHFYHPKSPFEKVIWYLVHLSSLFVADGLEDIRELVKSNKIEAYIITSRYDCLKGDFRRWLRKMKADEIFHMTYHNENDMQPHLFKEQKVKELGLDFFVEDNLDIVQHLNNNTKVKTLWITNAFDRHLPHERKFMTLKEAVKHLKHAVHITQ